jgi:signal transduction histidine kinase
MADKNIQRTKPPLAMTGRKDCAILSQRLLQSANSGVPLADFLREIAHRLLDFFASDSVELWVKRDDTCLRCRAGRRPQRDFRMETKALAALPGRGVKTELRSGSLVLPVTVAGEAVGLLQLKSRRKNGFAKEEIESYEEVARSLGVTLMSQLAHAALRERVKELTCLYSLAQLVEYPEVTVEAILRGIVEIVPPAWQYPEITTARISLDGRVFKTANFREGVHRQSAAILIGQKRRGSIDVVYTEARPELDEGPFLKEERNLIDAIARQIALIVERRQAAEEKLRLEGQLRHADRLATIGQLAAGVAHELNEPLSNILAFAQLAEKQTDLSSQAAADLEKIVMASLHAREIIKKLMLFARRMPPQKALVNLNGVIEEGLYFLESRCAKSGITINRRLSQRIPRITADPSQLQQVLVNLVVNAIHAMPNGGTLRIATRASDRQVMLIVEDDGVGMSEDTLGRIFIPFFTTKDVNEGTGLGLSVVHGIVTSHGGSIAVQSTPGRGTRFEIRLPLGIQESDEEDLGNDSCG